MLNLGCNMPCLLDMSIGKVGQAFFCIDHKLRLCGSIDVDMVTQFTQLVSSVCAFGAFKSL